MTNVDRALAHINSAHEYVASEPYDTRLGEIREQLEAAQEELSSGALPSDGGAEALERLAKMEEITDAIDNLGCTHSAASLRKHIAALRALTVEQRKHATPSPLEAQVHEALAIIEGGTDYERAHVAAILRNGLGTVALRDAMI